jgi:hypothetical protein
MKADTLISAAALAISILSLGFSFYFWRRSFRPILTVAAKTHEAKSDVITYDLVFLNSGTIPAKNIRITAEGALTTAFGRGASEKNKQRWLACFNRTIPILQNGYSVSCSFGTTQENDAGFWKYNAIIPVIVTYEGWFGWKYQEGQSVQIVNSESFTEYSWS